MPTFLQRCVDTFKDDRGLIIPIVDLDLIAVLEKIKKGEKHPEEIVLRNRLRKIILA